jgi:hypothetical protein
MRTERSDSQADGLQVQGPSVFHSGNCRRRLQSPNWLAFPAIGDWSRLLQSCLPSITDWPCVPHGDTMTCPQDMQLACQTRASVGCRENLIQSIQRGYQSDSNCAQNDPHCRKSGHSNWPRTRWIIRRLCSESGVVIFYGQGRKEPESLSACKGHLQTIGSFAPSRLCVRLLFSSLRQTTVIRRRISKAVPLERRDRLC